MPKINNLRSATLVALSAALLASLPAMAQEAPMDADSGDFQDGEILVAVPDAPPNLSGIPVMEISDQGMPLVDALAAAPGEPPPGGEKRSEGKQCHRGSGPMGCLTGENALTDDQYEKMYQLKNKMLDELGPKKAALCSAKRHLKDVLTRETVDTKEAGKLQDLICSLKSEVTALKLSNRVEMAQVLTAAQRKAIRLAMIKHCGREKMRGMMIRRMMMHHHRFGHHHHGEMR